VHIGDKYTSKYEQLCDKEITCTLIVWSWHCMHVVQDKINVFIVRSINYWMRDVK